MFTEDLDVFLDSTEHAIAATLQGGTTGGVKVVFDREAVEAFGAVVTSGPVAVAKAGAVATGDVGKTLTISGTAYTIRERRLLDDGAFAALHLQAP